MIFRYLFIQASMLILQEDLTVQDTNEILNDLKAGKKPKPGPRYMYTFK